MSAMTRLMGSGMKVTKRAHAIVTTATGLATINLTTDETANGPAYFNNIYGITVTPLLNAAAVVDVPRASVKSLSANNKQLVVQATQSGTVVTVLSLNVISTDRWVPDGTKLYVTIEGD